MGDLPVGGRYRRRGQRARTSAPTRTWQASTSSSSRPSSPRRASTSARPPSRRRRAPSSRRRRRRTAPCCPSRTSTLRRTRRVSALKLRNLFIHTLVSLKLIFIFSLSCSDLRGPHAASSLLLAAADAADTAAGHVLRHAPAHLLLAPRRTPRSTAPGTLWPTATNPGGGKSNIITTGLPASKSTTISVPASWNELLPELDGLRPGVVRTDVLDAARLRARARSGACCASASSTTPPPSLSTARRSAATRAATCPRGGRDAHARLRAHAAPPCGARRRPAAARARAAGRRLGWDGAGLLPERLLRLLPVLRDPARRAALRAPARRAAGLALAGKLDSPPETKAVEGLVRATRASTWRRASPRRGRGHRRRRPRRSTIRCTRFRRRCSTRRARRWRTSSPTERLPKALAASSLACKRPSSGRRARRCCTLCGSR